MPSLAFCGRQWALASDDLPAFAFMGALFHGAWLLLLVVFTVLAVSVQRPDPCDATTELIVFMSLLLLTTAVSTIGDTLVVWNGLKGSILQPSSRRFAEFVMYALTANFLIKVGIIGYGTVLVFYQKPQCLSDTKEFESLMQAVIISTWVIAGLYLCLFFVTYQAFPKNSVLNWKRRIRCINWCCCGNMGENESEPLARMALVFEQFFSPLNFSITDTLAALLLAAKRQSFIRHRRYFIQDDLPQTMPSLEASNDIEIPIRRPHGNYEMVDLNPEGLTTVNEDSELDLAETEQSRHPPDSLTEDRSNHEIDFQMVTTNFDEEVVSISTPQHRRLPAMDLSHFAIDDDGQEMNLSRRGSLSGEESLPETDVQADSPDSSTPVIGETSRSLTEEIGGRVSPASSVETTLSWSDNCDGPYLISPEGNRRIVLEKVDYPTLERMRLYHNYALASYGAFIYLAGQKRIVDVFGGCCGICIGAATPQGWVQHRHQEAITREGISPSLRQRLNEEAFTRYGFRKENILHKSHCNDLCGHLPYFVSLDYEDQAIVVAVRGTWSWSDIVIDFLIQPEPLDESTAAEVDSLLGEVRRFEPEAAGCQPHLSVHSGMLRSARALIADLEKAGLLSFLETGECRHPANGRTVDLPDVDNWKFVLTGHSLGAGVVSIATLLLKSRYTDKKIECFAISPPGCVMSPGLATSMSPFCHSLVHGKDIVPRISVRTIERLRDQMFRAATLCKKSKMRVFISSLLNFKLPEQDLFFDPDDLEEEPLEAYKNYRSAVKATDLKDMTIARDFIPPGRIVFLCPEKRGNNERNFEAVWISGTDLMREGILLSLFTIKDHFPYHSVESLSAVMERRGQF